MLLRLFDRATTTTYQRAHLNVLSKPSQAEMLQRNHTQVPVTGPRPQQYRDKWWDMLSPWKTASPCTVLLGTAVHAFTLQNQAHRSLSPLWRLHAAWLRLIEGLSLRGTRQGAGHACAPCFLCFRVPVDTAL